MSPVISICIGLCVHGHFDEKELAQKTREGVERVVSSRLTWKFRCEDTRFNITGFNSDPEKKTFLAQDDFNGSDKGFIWRHATEPSPMNHFEQITAVNQSYGFVINRRNTRPWTISRLELGGSNNRKTSLADDDSLITVLVPDFKIFIHAWDSVVSEPSFTVTQSRKDAHEWSVSFLVDGAYHRGSRVVRGDVILEPGLCLLKKFEAEVLFETGERSTYFGATSHGGEIDGVPIVSRHEYKDIEQPSGKIWTARTLTYLDVSRGDFANSDGVLTAFGLPEPVPSESPRFPAWVAALSIGILCVILGGWLRWKRS